MEYALRVLFSGLLYMLVGFIFGVVFWMHREREHREKLNAIEDDLTNPESYIWVNVDDRRPTHNGECLVEYCFEACPDVKCHSVCEFYVRENRFQHEGSHGLRVVRWAELPR